MTDRFLRLFVTVGVHRFVVHIEEQELRDNVVDNVGKLAKYIQKNPRYSGLCGDENAMPRVFMNSGGFEVLPSEPLSFIRDNDEITFVS